MKEIKSIIQNQLMNQIHQWDDGVESFADTSMFWRDAKFHVDCLSDEKRIFEAFEAIDWISLIKKDCTILDLGSGSGWLTSLLSNYENVKEIYALDANENNLLEFMPKVVSVMNGNDLKIQPVLGVFDNLEHLGTKFDLIVASASVHHSDNIQKTLASCKSALKKDGKLIILNEFPSSKLRYIFRVTKNFIKIIQNVLKENFTYETPLISSHEIIYNRTLGDRTYCHEQYIAYIKNAGFDVETINLKYGNKTEDKQMFGGQRYTHFICSSR